MLFRKTITLYCKNHTKHKNKIYVGGKWRDIFIKPVGTKSNPKASKGQTKI
jgi:hypothetical protein